VHSTSQRYDVLRAREQGVRPGEIARLTGVPPRSQRRIAHEEIPFGMTDQELHQQRGVGRPSVLTPEFREIIQEILREAPALAVSEVLRRLRSDHGYHGGKNPVYGFVKAHRPPAPAPLPVVRFEGVPGEFAQHDFGTLKVTYLDGRAEKLTFYAGRLKYSRALHVELAAAETTEAYLRGLEGAARRWGGLPLINVVDNARAVVQGRTRTEAGGVRVELNAQFATFLREVGVFGEPTHPYSGNQKGSVENLVKFVKHSFLLARRFRNREDLERQLEEWLQHVQAERPCAATGVAPVDRLAAERPRLRPLPWGERGYGIPCSVVVGREARVRRDGCGYSTPAGWIGQTITLRLHAKLVILQYDGQEIVHPRVPTNGRYSLLPEHRAPLFVKPRGAVMAKRQILMDLCPEAHQFFTEVAHRRPQTWREQDLPIIWELFEALGDVRLVAAFRHCVQQQAFGGEYLRAWAQGVAA
jgi:transposase